MTNDREVKKQTDFWGNEKESIYENGEKVGEYKFEERGGFMGMGTHTEKVEYNSSGDAVGYNRQEERGGVMGMGAETVNVHFDSDGNETGHSRVEERGGFMGMGTHHVSVKYDNDGNEISQSSSERRGTVFGTGGERVRVTRNSGGSTSSSDGVSFGMRSSNETSIKAVALITLGLILAIGLLGAVQNFAQDEAPPVQDRVWPAVESAVLPDDDEATPIALTGTVDIPARETQQNDPGINATANASNKARSALDAETISFERQQAEILYQYKESQRLLSEQHQVETSRYLNAQQWSLATKSDNEFGYRMKMLHLKYEEDTVKLRSAHDDATIKICSTHPDTCRNLVVWTQSQR